MSLRKPDESSKTFKLGKMTLSGEAWERCGVEVSGRIGAGEGLKVKCEAEGESAFGKDRDMDPPIEKDSSEWRLLKDLNIITSLSRSGAK